MLRTFKFTKNRLFFKFQAAKFSDRFRDKEVAEEKVFISKEESM